MDYPSDITFNKKHNFKKSTAYLWLLLIFLLEDIYPPNLIIHKIKIKLTAPLKFTSDY